MKDLIDDYKTLARYILIGIAIAAAVRLVTPERQWPPADPPAVETQPEQTPAQVDVVVVVLPDENDDEKAVLYTDFLDVGTKVPMEAKWAADYLRNRPEQVTLFVRVSDNVRYVAERDMLMALREAGVPMVVSYAEHGDCVALLGVEPIQPVVQPVQPAKFDEAARTPKGEPQYRRDARKALAVAGLVNEMGRGLQRHPNPFVAVPAAFARQVAVRAQVDALADLDMISHNPILAMGQGFLIGL